jgi:predicted DNA-binding protein (UPF0251 family)
MCDLTVVSLAVDEFEALRLCDGEGLDQTTAGRRMDVSRGTVQRLVTAGRRKLIDALLQRRAIMVAANVDEEDDDADLHTHRE